MKRFMRCGGSCLAVLIVAALAVPPVAAQVTMQFPVTRDTSIDGWEGHNGYGDPPVYDKTLATEEWSNGGNLASFRPMKFNTQHQGLLDWDTWDGNGTVPPPTINDWLAENTNPGDTLSWTLNMFPVDPPGTDDVPIVTVESVNDWEEGDQTLFLDHPTDFPNWDWTAGTPASTTNFAQTYWKLDGDGDRVLDEERSLPWVDNDTGTGGIDDNQYGFNPRSVTDRFSQGDRIPDFENFFKFTVADITLAAALATSVAVDLNPALVNAVLNDEVNRGLAFGLPDAQTAEGSNWMVFSKEATGGFDDDGVALMLPKDQWPGDFAPFLEVTVNGGAGGLIIGDMDRNGLIDFDDINPFVLALSDAAAYEADFGLPPVVLGDTDLNGAFDFDDIAGFVALLGGGSQAALVPEPATGLLAGFGLAGLLAAGWRRRRTA